MKTRILLLTTLCALSAACGEGKSKTNAKSDKTMESSKPVVVKSDAEWKKKLTEEQFLVAPGQPMGLLKTGVYRGGELADQDLDGTLVHRVSNRSAAPLVSLHLYGVAADRLTTGINRVYG